MLLTLATLSALCPQGPGTSTAAVVINEFAYDDSGTDDKEFVELYNRNPASAPPVDLSGWTIQCIEGTAPGGVNFTFTFPAGITIASGQYVVVGTATVPNLTPGITPPAVNWLENSVAADGLVLSDSTATVVDSVLWSFALWTAPVPAYVEGTGLWGRAFTADTAANPKFTSVSRRIDGYDTNNNGCDFVYQAWSPGASNSTGNTVALGYAQTFDVATGPFLTGNFASAFAPAIIADPAAVTNAIIASVPNVIAIPASPQGGNVAVMHDPTGGGNTQALAVTVGEDFLLECYVYVSGGNAPIGATEGESWGVGIGTTDSYAAPADIPGTYYAATSACAGVGNREPGASGIGWFAYQTAAQTAIYLVDMNDGGPGATILAGPIVATPGSNDGWQRLRIRASGTAVVANYGGTYGCDDGQRFTATLASRCAGQPYFQYRECVISNVNLKPLIIDRLSIYGTLNWSVTTAGTGTPTSAGIPVIGTAGGNPVIGNTGFQITGSTLVPNFISALILKLGFLDPGQVIPGAQPGATAYVVPILSTYLLFSDGAGTAAQSIGIPCDNAIVGLPVAGQILDLDFSLPYAVPIGTSVGQQIVIGN